MIHRPRNAAVIALGLAAAATLAIFFANFYLRGFGVYGDGLGYFAPLRSICFDHNLVVTDEYQGFAATSSRFGGGNRWPHPIIPEYSKYTVGMALVLAPFYLLGHLAALFLNLLHVPGATPNGLTWPYELFYCLGSAGIGIVGLLFTYRACRLYFDRMPSATAALGVWFASPIFYYLAVETSMSHAVTQGLLSIFLFYCLRGGWLSRPRQAAFMGCLLGLATLVRPQEILFGVAPVAMAVCAWRTAPLKTSLRSLLAMGAPAAMIASIQAAVYWMVFGSVFGNPYITEAQTGPSGACFNWWAPHFMPVLFSGYRGLFVWHPITLLGVLGLLLFARRNLPAFFALLAALLLQIYLVASWHCWWQGASLGSRMLSNSTLIFALGLASLWSHARGRLSWAPAALTLFLIFWNALLTAQYMTGMIPPEKPVSAQTLAANQARVLPFAWRHWRAK